MKNYPSFEELSLFVSLMQTLNLSKSAGALGLPVSTASRQLASLRDFFDDALFSRCRQGLLPTQKARELLPSVLAIVNSYSDLNASKAFDPASVQREINIGCVDNAPVSIFPHLMEELAQKAPGICISIHPLDSNRFDLLRHNELDLIISPMSMPPSENFHMLSLGTQSYSIICRLEHPLYRKFQQDKRPASTDDILQYRFVDVALSYRRSSTVLLRTIAYPELTLARSAIRSYYFLSFIRVVLNTDLLMVLPDKTAHFFANTDKLAILPTQAKPLTHTPKMVWHNTTHKDPVLQWVRSMIFATATYDHRLDGIAC